MVFFGGTYVTTIAAVEAFRQCGWERTEKHLKILFANYEKARLSKLVYLLSLMFGYLETITDWNNQLKYKISFLLFLTCRINKAQRVSLGLL